MNIQVDHSVFRKDMLDKCKLKNAKRRFNSTPESKRKPITLFKVAV